MVAWTPKPPIGLSSESAITVLSMPSQQFDDDPRLAKMERLRQRALTDRRTMCCHIKVGNLQSFLCQERPALVGERKFQIVFLMSELENNLRTLDFVFAAILHRSDAGLKDFGFPNVLSPYSLAVEPTVSLAILNQNLHEKTYTSPRRLLMKISPAFVASE
jgi:hypothetical protein